MRGWRRRDERRRPWVVGLLVVFAAVDLALVLAAVRARTAPRSATDALTVTEPTVSLTPVPSPAPPPPPVLDLAVRLSAVSDVVVFRSIGPRLCSPQTAATTASLQISQDGGATWADLRAPAPHVLALRFSSATAGTVTAADASCAPTQFTTTDGGSTWSAPAPPAGGWFLLATPTGVEVHAPAAVVPSPCPRGAPTSSEVAAVSTTNSLLLCTGTPGPEGQPRVLYRTTDSGRSWTPLAGSSTPASRSDRPDGLDNEGLVLAVASSSANVAAVAIAGAPSCPGMQVRVTVDGGRQWTGRYCVPGPTADRASLAYAGPSRLTLASLAGGASRTARSTDGGRTWAEVTASG